MNRRWIKIAMPFVLIMLGLGLVIGGNIWYTRVQVQHECQALDFIIHSQIQNQMFLNSVKFWANADGC